MGIYGKIFKTILGKTNTEKKSKTKKSKKMKLKKLTPEQKAKFGNAFKKVSGAVQKYGGGKPTVKVKPAPVKKQATAPATNFWTDTIDLGFTKITGKTAVLGGTGLLVGGFLITKAIRR